MQNETKKILNPWPVSIIAFFALAICGAIAWVIFCSHHRVDLVAADYYEQEIRYQDQMDRTHRAASLQVPAKIDYDDVTRHITISLPTELARQELKGWVQLYRPSAASKDQKFPLQVDATGAQSINAQKLSDGLWHVRVSWNANGSDYFCEQKLVVGAKPI